MVGAQILAYLVWRSVIPSATMIHYVRNLDPTSKPIMQTSATKLDLTKQSKWCKQNVEWPPNESASYGIIIRSSSIIEVRLCFSNLSTSIY